MRATLASTVYLLVTVNSANWSERTCLLVIKLSHYSETLVRQSLSTFILFFGCLVGFGHAFAFEGKVIDAATHHPIKDAVVTMSGALAHTASDGSFSIPAGGDQVAVRAWGYARAEAAAPRSDDDPIEIPLQAFSPRAVYLSIFGLAYRPIREPILKLRENEHINALVIDVKNDQGLMLFPEVAAASSRDDTDARKLRDRLAQVHRDGLYAIARIAAFKDGRLAKSHPEMALKADDGSVVHEADGIEWADPRNKAVQDRTIAIAVAAAAIGFDEIQFDYVRFPAMAGTSRPVPEAESRRAIIRNFLAQARTALTPYNVFIAADVFGYSCWDPDDTNIGQKLEDIAPVVDYICPMLYPSSFRKGIPASPMPLDHIDKIILLSLRRAGERSGLAPNRFRPWLQAFRDYRFDHRWFGPVEVKTQIQAADAFGSDGWMLWNPRNVYAQDAIPAHGATLIPAAAHEH